MKIKLFCCSDIHSYYDEWMVALKLKEFDIHNPNHKLVVCGDLFDRGPKTKEVYDFVKSLGDRFVYIKGNHEDLLEDCVADIVSGRSIGSHHFSNGTVRSIAAFCDLSEWDIAAPRRSEEVKQQVFTRMQPILEFISSKALNYWEVDNYIFVHGWVPTINENLTYWDTKPLKLAPRDWWDDKEDYLSREIWEEARWTNGMLAWNQGCKIPGKTIVCGHWHTSYAWSHIEHKYPEWPQKIERSWKKSFQPYIKEGIIAVDACTAYSGFVNCIAIEVNE